MASPAEVVAEIIATGSLASRTSEPKLSVGSEPPTPVFCVTVYDTGGQEADTDQLDVHRPTVQVRVRCLSYSDGYSKSKAIQQRLLGYPDSTVKGVPVRGIDTTSGIACIEQDDNARWIWVSNYQLLIGG